MCAEIPENEAARLEALARYDILDTGPEKVFDDIARLASQIGQTPISLVSFIDRERQWIKAKVGLQLEQIERAASICARTILGTDLLTVPDLLADSHLGNQPVLAGGAPIRFYAGAPLLTADGHGLGTLCVMDYKPRQFSPEQQLALMTLARVVVSELEQRRITAELAAALAKVKTLRGLLPICSYCKGIRNDEGYWLRLEAYLETNTEAHMTHGICPTCFKQHFPRVEEPAWDGNGRRPHERRKLKRLLKTHSRLVAQARTKADQIEQLCAARKDATRRIMTRTVGGFCGPNSYC